MIAGMTFAVQCGDWDVVMTDCVMDAVRNARYNVERLASANLELAGLPASARDDGRFGLERRRRIL